jgi:hypothetical protein
MKITATNRQSGRALAFEHDPQRRSVTGADAAAVLDMAARWDGMGILYGTQPAPAPDPLGSATDMAVMLFDHGYDDLPAELSALLPAPEAIPADAVA